MLDLTPHLSAVTGFGNMLARPLFREKHSPDMSEADATELMHEALKVRLLSWVDMLRPESSACSMCLKMFALLHLCVSTLSSSYK